MEQHEEENAFTSRLVASAAHEILADGVVIGWAVDELWAAAICQALEMLIPTGVLP